MNPLTIAIRDTLRSFVRTRELRPTDYSTVLAYLKTTPSYLSSQQLGPVTFDHSFVDRYMADYLDLHSQILEHSKSCQASDLTALM